MERKREMWDRSVVNREGWVARMETACEEVVARRAGREAENTEADELIRWALVFFLGYCYSAQCLSS